MTLTDFLIGFFLMNAMPHFVLGVWKGRMFSLFGFGNRQNLLYSLLNATVSLGLFISKYGLGGLSTHGIYVGAVTMLLIYYCLLYTSPSPRDATLSRMPSSA